jgi:hypothetical protein
MARSAELTASALKGKAHVAFLRGRYGEAARLDRRAARALGGEPSRQLAESLNGVIVSEASRGVLAENEIEALDSLSQRIGWDRYWLESLHGAWFAMRRAKGTLEDVAVLAVVMLLVSFRNRPDEGKEDVSDEGLDSDFRQALLSGMMVQAWVAASTDTSRRNAVMVAAEEIGGEDARELVDQILKLVADLPPVEDPLAREGGRA